MDDRAEPSGPPSRPARPARVLAVAGGLGVAAVLFLVGGLTQRSDEPDPHIPADIVALIPEPGTVRLRQDEIGADLRPLLAGTVVIDGREIPEDEIELRQLGTSWRVTFTPGEGRSIEELEPGSHRVEILWWSAPRGRPVDEDGDGVVDGEISSYGWDFTVE